MEEVEEVLGVEAVIQDLTNFLDYKGDGQFLKRLRLSKNGLQFIFPLINLRPKLYFFLFGRSFSRSPWTQQDLYDSTPTACKNEKKKKKQPAFTNGSSPN